MRKLLVSSVIVLSSCLIFAVFSVFAESLSPSENARSKRSSHDISSLAIGEYRIDIFQRENQSPQKVLLVRDYGGNIHQFLLPTENNQVVMPDFWWGWGYYSCADF